MNQFRVVKYETSKSTFYKIEQKRLLYWLSWADTRVNYFTTRQDAIDKVIELREAELPKKIIKTILDV